MRTSGTQTLVAIFLGIGCFPLVRQNGLLRFCWLRLHSHVIQASSGIGTLNVFTRTCRCDVLRRSVSEKPAHRSGSGTS